MIPLNSTLVGREEAYDQVLRYLHSMDFSLGGNWDYDHGSFDRSLDEANKVWLRIPFQVTHGALDGETEATEAIIQIGSPYVLKHLYNEGLDPKADPGITAALFDQFQDPVDRDAKVEDQWVVKAKSLLEQVEARWLP